MKNSIHLNPTKQTERRSIMNSSTNIPSSTPVVTRKLAVVPRAAAVAPAVSIVGPVARGRAANGNSGGDPETVARRRAVEELYTSARPALVHAARRLVSSADDARDIVQEAFVVLLGSPTRKVTRAALWCIARDLARERRAEEAVTEAYVEGDAAGESEAGEWLERVLGG
jgi:Sigma-70 region 2